MKLKLEQVTQEFSRVNQELEKCKEIFENLQGEYNAAEEKKQWLENSIEKF